MSSVGAESSYMLNEVDERSAVGSAGRALSIHWDNRFRKDEWALLGVVVVFTGPPLNTVSARIESRRGVGGFNNVELPEDDLACDRTGSLA